MNTLLQIIGMVVSYLVFSYIVCRLVGEHFRNMREYNQEEEDRAQMEYLKNWRLK